MQPLHTHHLAAANTFFSKGCGATYHLGNPSRIDYGVVPRGLLQCGTVVVIAYSSLTCNLCTHTFIGSCQHILQQGGCGATYHLGHSSRIDYVVVPQGLLQHISVQLIDSPDLRDHLPSWWTSTTSCLSRSRSTPPSWISRNSDVQLTDTQARKTFCVKCKLHWPLCHSLRMMFVFDGLPSTLSPGTPLFHAIWVATHTTTA